jgi:hypothetical protein
VHGHVLAGYSSRLSLLWRSICVTASGSGKTQSCSSFFSFVRRKRPRGCDGVATRSRMTIQRLFSPDRFRSDRTG